MSELNSATKIKQTPIMRRSMKPKYENSFFTSLSRLRRIQSLLSSGTSSSPSSSPDAVLCILGIDSRYDEGMTDLANYLFFDIFKSDRNLLYEHGLSEEIFEDVMLVIRSHRVDFYCNPLAIRHFLPYIGPWENLKIHCLKDNEYNEDDDAVEEFKIQSLVSMVDGCLVIGLPVRTNGHSSKKFDKMLIEKWPIIQAFALDGFGTGGFFTMKYQVVDMTSDLCCIYRQLDPVALEILVTEKLEFLEIQWRNMMSTCNRIESSGADMTEDIICEPLKSYFEHGIVLTDLKKTEKNIAEEVALPFVLFGTNTDRKHLKQIESGARINGTDKSQNTLPTHMICQAVSPNGQLRCRRTYFFRNDAAVSCLENFDPSSLELAKDKQKCQQDKDVRILSLVYKACVVAASAFISALCKSSDLSQAKVAAEEELEKELERLGIPVEILSWLRNNAEIEIHNHDTDERSSILPDNVTEAVCSVVVTAFDIPSVCHPGLSLGSVSFADSFVSSVVQVQYRGGQIGKSGAAVAVTSCIPPFMNWKMDEESRRIGRQLRMQLSDDQLKGAGARLCAGSGASFVRYEGCTSGDILRNGELYIYESVFAFVHDVSGCVVIPKRVLKSVCFFDGDAMGIVATVMITFVEEFRNFLPTCLCSSSSNCVVCFLAPKSKAYRAMLSSVLPSWKNDDDLKKLLTIWSELPSDLVELHNQFQNEFTMTGAVSFAAAASRSTDYQTIKCRLPCLNSFIQNLLVSRACVQCPVFTDHLPAVLGHSEYDPGQFDDSGQILLTVVTGSPGSRKEILFNNIKRELRTRGDNWTVIQASASNGVREEFDVSVFNGVLEKAWNNLNSKGSSRHKRLRALVLYPGFLDLTDLLKAIRSHPRSQMTELVTVGAVTVCVDPLDFFMERFYSLPKTLECCRYGLANNVAITNSSSCPDEVLNRVQTLIRSANPGVAFLSADHGRLTRAEDIEAVLAEDLFMSSSVLRARYLVHPGWWQGRYVSGPPLPEMSQVLLRFSQPLEKSKFLSRLNGLKSNFKEYPFRGNIYHVRGQMCFTDSVQLFEVTFTALSGHLRLVPIAKEERGTSGSDLCCYLLIIGCQLNEKRLKDWLRESRECSKEKPLRTRDSLTSAEIQRTHKARHLDPLPDGWFYSGSQFVCLDGERSDIHPNLEKFLEEYLDACNRQVRQYNASLRKDKARDLFD